LTAEFVISSPRINRVSQSPDTDINFLHQLLHKCCRMCSIAGTAIRRLAVIEFSCKFSDGPTLDGRTESAQIQPFRTATFRDSVLHLSTRAMDHCRQSVDSSDSFEKNTNIAARKKSCQLLFQSFLTFYGGLQFRASHRN